MATGLSFILIVNASGATADGVPAETAAAGSSTFPFTGRPTTFVGSANGNTTFIAPSPSNVTFDGAGQNNTLDLSQVAGSLRVDAATGSAAASGGSDTFAGIQTFIGSANGHTTFIAPSPSNLTFHGAGQTNTLDLSPAAGSLRVDAATGTATASSGSDTFTGIQSFVGSANGHTTFIAPSPSNVTFHGVGPGNTLDLSQEVVGSLRIDAITGSATASGGSDTFTDIQTFIGSANGSTTFVAAATFGYTFHGIGRGNALDLHAVGAPLAINVPTGTAKLSRGSDAFSGVQTVVGSHAGRTDFIVGTSVSQYIDPGVDGGDRFDLSKLPVRRGTVGLVNLTGARVFGIPNDTAVVGRAHYRFAPLSDIHTFVGLRGRRTIFYIDCGPRHAFTIRGGRVLCRPRRHVAGSIAAIIASVRGQGRAKRAARRT